MLRIRPFYGCACILHRNGLHKVHPTDTGLQAAERREHQSYLRDKDDDRRRQQPDLLEWARNDRSSFVVNKRLRAAFTPAFNRDLKKKATKRKWNLPELESVVDLILENSTVSSIARGNDSPSRVRISLSATERRARMSSTSDPSSRPSLCPHIGTIISYLPYAVAYGTVDGPVPKP